MSSGRTTKPDKIQFVSGLPKTRSGKIMRRILLKVAENEMGSLGDTSTLLGPAVVSIPLAWDDRRSRGGCDRMLPF